MPTANIQTLGCKLNQYESEQIREQLENAGYAIVDSETLADIYIINSCTVTAKTDSDTRRLARRAKRLNPEAFVVVTGCYAQCSPEALIDIPEINLVVGNDRKFDIVSLLPPINVPLNVTSSSLPSLIEQFSGHTRCFIKVQEGCNANCTYCIIPRARGRSSSIPSEQVLEQALRLSSNGYPEVVLIGTHLGQYGQDLPENVDLSVLVSAICAMPEVQRVRLSSLEPCEVTQKLISIVTDGGKALVGSRKEGKGKVCRHLHIPLQSGCDHILQRMNRPYDTQYYVELLRCIWLMEPLTCLGCDVIAGFPGETATDFDQTLALLEDLPLAYLHAFTYSTRPGTPAADMPDQVPIEIRQARNKALRDLSLRKRIEFAEAMIGQTLETVLQTPHGTDHLSGVTDNYLTIFVPASESLLGHLVACEITAAVSGELQGRLID